MNDKIFNYFANLIYQNTGIIYSDHNSHSLVSRLESISKKQGYRSIEELFDAFNSNQVSIEFRKIIIDLATNNETFFFRDPIVWSNFKNVIIEKIKTGQTYFSFWSAASSSGQEAISIAITMEEIKKHYKKIQYDIEASDISETILNKAKKGEYSLHEITRGLSTERREIFFTKINNEAYKVMSEISDKIIFSKNNLFSLKTNNKKFDVIFLRNVLLYQKTENKSSIIKNVNSCLKSDGFIILGAGESMLGLNSGMSSTLLDGSIFYQKSA